MNDRVMKAVADNICIGIQQSKQMPKQKGTTLPLSGRKKEAKRPQLGC